MIRGFDAKRSVLPLCTLLIGGLTSVLSTTLYRPRMRRELIIGHSVQQRVLIVSFTDRGRRTRIIGTRKATARERRDHEENSEKQSTP